MAVNEISDFIFENYYKQIQFSKENSFHSIKHQKKDLQLLAVKLTEKIPDLRNAKKHYLLFIIQKNTKLVKQLKIIHLQPKGFENPNIVDISKLLQNIKKLEMNYPTL